MLLPPVMFSLAFRSPSASIGGLSGAPPQGGQSDTPLTAESRLRSPISLRGAGGQKLWLISNSLVPSRGSKRKENLDSDLGAIGPSDPEVIAGPSPALL